MQKQGGRGNAYNQVQIDFDNENDDFCDENGNSFDDYGKKTDKYHGFLVKYTPFRHYYLVNNAITDGCVAPLTMLLTIVIMYHKILSF